MSNDRSNVSLSPFDFISAIHQRRNLIVDEVSERQYNPYIINKGLSFGHDTIIPANEMNCRAHLPKKAQNIFFINIIEPRKRYNKWLKADKIDNAELVSQYYGYSIKKALQVLPLLSDDQLKAIKEKLYKGGL